MTAAPVKDERLSYEAAHQMMRQKALNGILIARKGEGLVGMGK